MMWVRRLLGLSLLAAALCAAPAVAPGQKAPARAYPYVELEGRAEDFKYHREWRSYYWREDFTLVVRDAAGAATRVISREPTPWTGLRLGTTYTGLKVDWAARPRVRVIGVRGVDRIPQEFYGLKLDDKATVTAMILRVDVSGKADGKPEWKDFYVNNWFHPWGSDADRKLLPHYANDDAHYTVYGYVGGTAAPFDAEGQRLLEKYRESYNGIIYHARVVKADNDVGFALRPLHFMGRHKKTLNYDVFHGDPGGLVKLDNTPPKK